MTPTEAQNTLANAKAAGWSVTNTREAAAFAALGFVVTTEVTEIVEDKGRVQVRLFIGERSTRPEFANEARKELYVAYRAGSLVQTQPRHPFLLALLACQNDEWMQRWRHHGGAVGMRQEATGWALGGQGAPVSLEMLNVPQSLRVATTDRALAAGLATIGAVPLSVETGGDRAVYVFGPKTLGGELVAPLMRRDAADKRNLALETENPGHPLCHAYAGAWARVQLARHLQGHPRNLILRAQGSQRRAFISENPTGRVMERVERFFGVG